MNDKINEDKNVGEFGPMKPALHYFLNYRCPLQCCLYAGHFQRGRLQKGRIQQIMAIDGLFCFKNHHIILNIIAIL